MKVTHIIAIVAIAVAIAVIVTTASDASSYADFSTAKEMYDNGNTSEIHVVGTLKKDDQGNIVGIKPTPDRLAFNFSLIDQEGIEQQVFYNEPMPVDFLKSEQVVVIGAFGGNVFKASKILMKCPSKYQDEEIKI